ncbi:hypothetical protein ACPAY5_12300 [Staphylococcus caledonicus]
MENIIKTAKRKKFLHVDKSVNELSYKLLEEKYNYAKAVKELVDSLSEAA